MNAALEWGDDFSISDGSELCLLVLLLAICAMLCRMSSLILSGRSGG